MQFGINTFLFSSPFINESTRFFSAFRDWGFDFVEIALEDPANIDPISVRRALDEQGLACHTMCAAMGPERDLRGTLEQQQTALTYLKALLDVMPVLGATVLCGPLYSSVGRAGFTPPEDYEQQFQTVTMHLTDLARYAEERGLVLAIEPLNRFETDFINTVGQGLRLVEAVGSPALGLHLDTFHMNIEEKSQADAIRRAGSALRHLHASGSDRGTPGNDHIDWTSLAQALQEIQYEGAVVIESFTPDVKEIAKAAAIWRQIEPSSEEIARKGLQYLKRVLSNQEPVLA